MNLTCAFARNFRVSFLSREIHIARRCATTSIKTCFPHVNVCRLTALHLKLTAARSPLIHRDGIYFKVASDVRSTLLPRVSERHFHTSQPRRALPAPLIWLIFKPLQKLVAVLLGRSLRKWWTSLPNNRKDLLRDWVSRHRWHLVAGTGVAVLIVALLLLIHLDESPITGRTRLIVFSRKTNMDLAALTSEGYLEKFAEHLLPVTDPVHQMVDQLVQALAERNKDVPEVSEIPWSVHVVQSPEINAFVLPNGKVFMFTGMLESVADVDQLIIVLGHEMAHAIMDHSAEQASLSHLLDLLSLLLLTAIWAVCPSDSMALLGAWVKGKLTELMFHRPYSRKLEAEADQVGLQLAAKACADVRAGPVFWKQLEISDKLSGEITVPEWLSTHPSNRNRSSQLDQLIPKALELRESCLCPPLSPTDPRVTFEKTVQLLLEKNKVQMTKVPQALPAQRPALSAPQAVQHSFLSGVDPLRLAPVAVAASQVKSPAPVPVSVSAGTTAEG